MVVNTFAWKMEYIKIVVKSTNWRIWSTVEAPLSLLSFSALFSLSRIKKYWATIFKNKQHLLPESDEELWALLVIQSSPQYIILNRNNAKRNVEKVPIFPMLTVVLLSSFLSKTSGINFLQTNWMPHFCWYTKPTLGNPMLPTSHDF